MRRSEGDQIIADLLEWGSSMGDWESVVWKRARTYMDQVRDTEDIDGGSGERKRTINLSVPTCACGALMTFQEMDANGEIDGAVYLCEETHDETEDASAPQDV